MTRAEYLSRVDNVILRKGDAENLPATAPVVAMFAGNFMPSDPPTATGDNMTSLEIVAALEDTCQLSVTVVALVMTYLGYRLHVNEYRGHEWSMVYIAEKNDND